MSPSSRIVFTGEFQEFHGVFALHGGEMFQEEFQRVPGSQIVEQGLRHHAGVPEDQCPSEDAGIRMNGALIQNHHGVKLPDPAGAAMN